LYEISSSKTPQHLEEPGIEREEEKLSPPQDNRTILSNKGASRIRGGAVTQGFKAHERRRTDLRNSTREPSERQEKYVQENHFVPDENYMYEDNYPQNPLPHTPQTYGRYENMHRQLPTPYSNPYEMAKNEEGIGKEGPNLNIVPTGFNAGRDFRNNEYLKSMSEMMNTVCAYNNNNFKMMVESHTHILSKLIDKVHLKKKKSNKFSSSQEDSN